MVQGVWGLRLCSLVAFRRNRFLLDSFASDKVDLGWGGNGSVDGFSSGSEFQGKWLVSAVDSDSDLGLWLSVVEKAGSGVLVSFYFA